MINNEGTDKHLDELSIHHVRLRIHKEHVLNNVMEVEVGRVYTEEPNDIDNDRTNQLFLCVFTGEKSSH